jgi:hypothetical protein
MSDEYFPTLPGLAWDVEMAPEFRTVVQRSVNNHELRASFACMPVWHFKLTYDCLREDTLYSEMQTLCGFFLARYGKWDSFRYVRAEDANVSNHVFAVGDGACTVFRLTRPMGNEAVGNANITSLLVGNSSAGYTLAANGLVTFNSAPAANASISWSGSQFYRCRFKDDTTEFTQFMRQLWEAKTVEFIGSLGDLI